MDTATSNAPARRPLKIAGRQRLLIGVALLVIAFPTAFLPDPGGGLAAVAALAGGWLVVSGGIWYVHLIITLVIAGVVVGPGLERSQRLAQAQKQQTARAAAATQPAVEKTAPVSPVQQPVPVMPRAGAVGKGKFRAYGYTFETKEGITAFEFHPPLPANDRTLTEAMRHVLTTDFGVDLDQATEQQTDIGKRFITSRGAFDVAPVEDHGKVVGLGVMAASEAALKESASGRLLATASFDGTQFEIANTGSLDWTDVKFDVNGGVLSSGYVFRLKGLKARSVYTVGAMQFADSNGNRFNPLQMKPQTLTISATLPGGGTGIRTIHFE